MLLSRGSWWLFSPYRGAEADLHGPACSAGHRDHTVVNVPVVQGVRVQQAQGVDDSGDPTVAAR